MQPPLPFGTLLQSRYRVVQLLGQGGFGRTYLAEDQNRYDERCAIKEFVPQQGEDHFSSKATQLFQREAAILYQIQHPQIPQFRATFEIEQRLFLVQDYVEGPSYREVLNQRRAQGAPFSEAEVRQFLQQMLPVLAHIHSKGIIHRDISPDNLILRNRDRLPVLIDFGVVKEVVTRMQMIDTTHQATTVGKPGYAPSEQMQSGRAYPSSDLYALAVTAAVLLTGKEPQDLFDDVNLAWHWQQYAAVTPGLAQVLNKAMSYRPGDRYQSVSEMAQALGAAGNLASPVTPYTPQRPPTPPPSQVRTVAMGRPYQATTVATNPIARPTTPAPVRPATPSVLDDDEGSIWENPWAVAALAIGLALIAGLGGWGLVNALNRNQPETSPTPEPPTLTLNPDRTVTSPTPTPTEPEETEVEPVEYSQRLGLQAGESTTVEGSLRANETVNYQLEGQEGQTLLAQLEDEGVLMTILAPNGNPADGQAQRVLGWTGTFDFTGQYTIQLSPIEGVDESNYILNVSLEESDASETPEEPTEPEEPAEPEESEEPAEPVEPEEPAEPAEPEVQPNISEQRVRFPAGQSSILVANSVGPGRVRRYVINLREGEILEAELSGATGPITFSVLQPTDEPLSGARSVELWEGEVPVGGDYAIEVVSSEDAEFTLRIGAQ
ncbi:MAG: serine/threonine protein kinase [Leptolyngbya sp. SIO1E4]|nr:serine/threonine protein kinase [Leptolyngbya sp. SIO1E4]